MSAGSLCKHARVYSGSRVGRSRKTCPSPTAPHPIPRAKKSVSSWVSSSRGDGLESSTFGSQARGSGGHEPVLCRSGTDSRGRYRTPVDLSGLLVQPHLGDGPTCAREDTGRPSPCSRSPSTSATTRTTSHRPSHTNADVIDAIRASARPQPRTPSRRYPPATRSTSPASRRHGLSARVRHRSCRSDYIAWLRAAQPLSPVLAAAEEVARRLRHGGRRVQRQVAGGNSPGSLRPT